MMLACALPSAQGAVGSMAWAKAHEGKEATLPLGLKGADPLGFLSAGVASLFRGRGDELLATSKPFNQHAMIMAHDAATTYLAGGLLHPINNWAKTQADGGFTGMLNCGARAFDFRADVLSSGELVFHHGSVTVDHPVDAALGEVVAWANANARSAEEIVLLHAFACSGTNCDAAVGAAFAAHNITYITSCSELNGLTLQGAAARAVLPGGGLVLAVKDCLADHYQAEVACSGYQSGGKDVPKPKAVAGLPKRPAPQVEGAAAALPSAYTCYADSGSKALPLERMWSYLANVSITGPPADGTLYSHQALWQESDASVAIGVLHGSSLLKDEESSTLNALLAQRVASGAWNVSAANLVEVNNVCDGGPALLAALRKAQAQARA